MIGVFRNTEPTPLDEQIDAVLKSMTMATPESEEYDTLLKHLERLNELKTKQRRAPVSMDTLANVGGTLLGILMIVVYEQKHVWTSKAFGFGIKKSPVTSN